MTESAYAAGLQIPNSCDGGCAAAYLPIYRDCYPTLQTIAQFQGAGALEAFDALNVACQLAQEANTGGGKGGDAVTSASMINLALGLPTGQGSCAFDPCVEDGSCGVNSDHSPESYDSTHRTGVHGAGGVAMGILCPICGLVNSVASHDEVEHHAGVNGVRRCGAASSSTVYYTAEWGGEPDRAIDGKNPAEEESEDHQALCAATDAAPSWWQLDLGRPAHIDHISVYHGANSDEPDDCDDHVGSANVIVSTTPYFSAGVVCGPLNDPTQAPEEVACDGVEGQFITVSNPGSSNLVICEVEVWGSWIPGRRPYVGGWVADPCGQP